MRNKEKMTHVVIILNTMTSRFTNYILRKIIRAIETIIVDNVGINSYPLIVSDQDKDDLKSYIVQFWGIKEQINAIRVILLRKRKNSNKDSSFYIFGAYNEILF